MPWSNPKITGFNSFGSNGSCNMTFMPNLNMNKLRNNAFSDENTISLNMPMSIDNNAIFNNTNDNITTICHNNINNQNYRNSDINYDNMELSSVPNMS